MKKNLLFIVIATLISATVVGIAININTSKKSQEVMAELKAMQLENQLAEQAKLEEQEKLEAVKPVVKSTPAKAKSTSYQSPKMVSESQNAAKTTEEPEAAAKKGWSKAAKGAVIGGASGAVIGAVINKRNRTAGAVIGGVLGAGAGYGIGRGMDKKDGRS